MTSSEALPLDGLRVVDLADLKGELAGRVLADLGAEVLRVEPSQVEVLGEEGLHSLPRGGGFKEALGMVV